MDRDPQGHKKRGKYDIRASMLSGLLIMAPLVVTIWVLKFLFVATADILAPGLKYALRRLEEHHPEIPAYLPANDKLVSFLVGLLAIAILLVIIYILGLLTKHVVGRRLVKGGENLLMRVPLVKTIYGASKQVMEAVSMPDRSAFKSVVAIEFYRPGYLTIGFLTGTISLSGREYCKIFVATTPNPTTGFLIITEPQLVQVCDITVEEAFKVIISGGILSPRQVATRPLDLQAATLAPPVTTETNSSEFGDRSSE